MEFNLAVGGDVNDIPNLLFGPVPFWHSTRDALYILKEHRGRVQDSYRANL